MLTLLLLLLPLLLPLMAAAPTLPLPLWAKAVLPTMQR